MTWKVGKNFRSQATYLWAPNILIVWLSYRLLLNPDLSHKHTNSSEKHQKIPKHQEAWSSRPSVHKLWDKRGEYEHKVWTVCLLCRAVGALSQESLNHMILESLVQAGSWRLVNFQGVLRGPFYLSKLSTAYIKSQYILIEWLTEWIMGKRGNE